MRKRTLIQAVDGTAEPTLETNSISEELIEQTSEDSEDQAAVEWIVEDVPSRRFPWLIPSLAITAIIAWTGFFAYAHREAFQGGAALIEWSALIADWAIPIVLVIGIWLLAMRNSTREAARFSQASQDLASHSADLEAKLTRVNRELSLAREFLASQTRELDYLGRTATERLSEHADRLQSLVGDNGAQIDAIARVSETALENMDRLRDNLPVIATSAKDVSNQIGGAGRSAQARLEDLIEGFARLNQFGEASERQVATLREHIDATLAEYDLRIEQLTGISGQRFDELRQNSETVRNELAAREVDALASLRTRFAALQSELADTEASSAQDREAALASLRESLLHLRRDATEASDTIRSTEAEALAAWASQLDALRDRLSQGLAEVKRLENTATENARWRLESLQADFAATEQQMADRLAAFSEETEARRASIRDAERDAQAELENRLAALDEAIADRRAAQAEQLSLLAAEGDELGERIALLGTIFETINEQGRSANEGLAEGIARLSERLEESRASLQGTDIAVTELTDASVRLLELIQASAKQTREDLPAAMEAGEDRLQSIEQRVEAVKQLLDRAQGSGETLAERLQHAEGRSLAVIAGIDEFQTRFGDISRAQTEDIEQLRKDIAALADESGTLSNIAQGELRTAIGTLENAARSALAAIEDEQAAHIMRIAENVGRQSAEAIDRALQEHTAEAITALDSATTRSSEAGRDAARQLRDQLAKVNELTGNLETRIAHARERASESVDNEFSRRVALITESLNSNAIDIAKALSTEVTDTAWASYLRGDRGIFTRRAVRLIDNTEAREIAELYDVDTDFREHVSRYIHDFEAMLRTMLSTRDGNAVSVTLLSSDMGKLYVVLAQALERLRQ